MLFIGLVQTKQLKEALSKRNWGHLGRRCSLLPANRVAAQKEHHSSPLQYNRPAICAKLVQSAGAKVAGRFFCTSMLQLALLHQWRRAQLKIKTGDLRIVNQY
jgi:hypothetical protein